MQDHHPHDDLDAEPAALQHARQAAGLALQMKAQRQLMHVDEGEISELAHRVHRHPGEDSVAPLGQHRHQHAHAAVADGHDQGRCDQPHRPVRRLHRRGIRAGQRVDRPFERERHRQRRQLGDQQQHHRPDHAHLEIGAIAGPDVRPQMHQRPDQGRLFDGFVGGRRRFAAPGTNQYEPSIRAWNKTAPRFAVARGFSVDLHSVRHIERLNAACTLAEAILSRFAAL